MQDFTKDEYLRLLRLVKEKYEFITYPEARKGGDLVALWRHDIDYSPRLAIRMAEIEHGEGIAATYFVHLHSRFYNALDDYSVECIKEISDLGHVLGLHFDPSFSQGKSLSSMSWMIDQEKQLIEEILDVDLVAMSIHNPSLLEEKVKQAFVNRYMICQLVNADSESMMKYRGVSDSLQRWKYGTVEEVIEENPPRLKVLTHPIWWMVEGQDITHKVEAVVNICRVSCVDYFKDLISHVG